ncbi:MAG: OprO/OprP family phosphate-selective porin [Flavobacteriales bacterium]|nr:OprO/OprP family phosphate-selective porin [Flavobacteriales bacterium]
MTINQIYKALFAVAFFVALHATSAAQDDGSAASVGFELGNGLQIATQDGAYQFGIGGMLQPSIGFMKTDDNEADYFLNARRSYFNISGKAVNEKVNFFIQVDFSSAQALLDAWVAYQVHPTTSITFGQKQTIGNNREMLVMEDQLQFMNRSLLSTAYSRTGREFGLFINSSFGSEKFIVEPAIAITSGDGRNSFGSDSRDVDLGGLKYAARVDIYPLGKFTGNNRQVIADLAHEEKPKLVIGAAASYNDGASGMTGEGHGDFYIYNVEGSVQLPDYRKVYGDMLFKFKGFSLLGEYVIATATSLQQTYTDQLGQAPLLPTQISQFLALGRGYNGSLGYTTKNGYGVDLRYAAVQPEFEFNTNSLIGEMSELTLGFSRYLKGNNLKLHGSVSQVSDLRADKTIQGNIMFQVRF